MKTPYDGLAQTIKSIVPKNDKWHRLVCDVKYADDETVFIDNLILLRILKKDGKTLDELLKDRKFRRRVLQGWNLAEPNIQKRKWGKL